MDELWTSKLSEDKSWSEDRTSGLEITSPQLLIFSVLGVLNCLLTICDEKDVLVVF